MKLPLSGKLANTPELKVVTTKAGNEQKVTNFTIFVYDPNAPLKERKDGSSYRAGIPLRCVAWGENAEDICKMKKGDQLTFSSVMRSWEHQRKDGAVTIEPQFVVRKIDKENDIHKQLSNLLTCYEEGTINQIFEREVQPSFSEIDQDKDLSNREQTMAKEPEQDPEKE